MSDREKRLLTALVLMVRQYLAQDEDGTVDSYSMSAGEHALKVLAEYGLMTPDSRDPVGTRLAHWTAAAEEF